MSTHISHALSFVGIIIVMGYAISFYGLNTEHFLKELRNEQIVSQVVAHAQTEEIDNEELEHLSQLLTHGIQGNWPRLDDNDAFVAFGWLLQPLCERIDLEDLDGFRDWGYWRDMKLEQSLIQTPPPFAVPEFGVIKADELGEGIPRIYFLPNSAMQALIEDPNPPAKAELPDGAYATRLELLEVIESLEEDGLDMIGICFGSE